MERMRFYYSGRDATKQGRPEAYIDGVDLMLTFGRQVPLMMTANEEQKTKNQFTLEERFKALVKVTPK
jgi:hypothetical protein